MGRKDRKIDALAVPSRSERVGTTRPHRPRRRHHRWSCVIGIEVRRWLSIRGEDQSPERRYFQAHRVRVAMHRMRFGMDLPSVADPTAAIFHCVRVDTLAIAPGARHPNAIIFARHWRKVAHNDRELLRISAMA